MSDIRRRLIKIVFFIRSLGIGGAQRQMVQLASGLSASGNDVTVLTMYPECRYKNELEKAGIKIVSLAKRGRWDILAFMFRLIREVRSAQPDIFHSYLSTQNVIAALIKPFCRGTKIVWGIRSSFMDMTQYDKLEKFAFWLEKILSGVPHLIIVNSKKGGEMMLENGFPLDKLVVIPNGINTKSFYPDMEAGLALRKEWGASKDSKIIGIVGRIDPMKDHPTFFKAAAMLIGKKENLRFVIVGSGEEQYVMKMRLMADEMNLSKHFIWAGEVDNMLAIYNALDVNVLSSYGEGFSNAVGEAMACGVPCVVTDVGDLAWIVGDTGVVVEPKNPEKLSSAILIMLAMIADESGDPGELAALQIEAMFTTESLTQNTSKALESLL